MKATLEIDDKTQLIENRFPDMVNFIYEYIQHYKITNARIEIDVELRKIVEE